MCRACRGAKTRAIERRGDARAGDFEHISGAACQTCENENGSRRLSALDGASYDVVIAGAGAAGSSFAMELARVGGWGAGAGAGARALALGRDARAKRVRAEADGGGAVGALARRHAVTMVSLASVRSRAVEAVEGEIFAVDAEARRVRARDGGGEATISYGTLVIATGAVPRWPMPVDVCEDAVDVRCVRDVEDVEALARTVVATATRAGGARRVALAGNGGIALELVDALCGTGLDVPGLEECELTWLVRHGEVGDAFFDVDAAEFLSRALEARRASGETAGRARATGEEKAPKRAKFSSSRPPRARSSKFASAAAGPDWIARFRAETAEATPGPRASTRRRMRLRVVKNAEIRDAKRIVETGASVLTLSNGSTVEVDLVVAAAGVEPRCDWLSADVAPRSSVDGGILVDECMRTVGPYADSILAIGDACTMESRSNKLDVPWFQMRLWSQAAQAGAFAARVVAGVADADAFGFNYELFTHVTTFFGLKVILLGLYNAQKLDREPESDVVTYQRETLGDEPTYVRVLLLRGRMMGAVLIGETDLEETFENLILDGVDLSRFGPELLDPEADLEDYFD